MNAEQLKNSILQRAIEGKLVEQRPEEGTAAELLREIKVEKARLVKEGKIKKEKPLPEIKEEEIPFEIPESWVWVRLNDLVCKEIKRGKSPQYAEKGHTLVFAQKCNTKEETINLQLAYYLDEQILEKYHDAEFMQDNDIVINSTGIGTLGRIGIFTTFDAPPDTRVVPDSHVTVIRASQNINTKYIFYMLKRQQPYLERMGDGSTKQKELKADIIKKLLVPLPPLAEQKRIVAKIEELLPHVERYGKAHDELTALNEKFPDAMKKSILQYAMEGKLVEQREEEGTAKELLTAIKAEKARLVVEGKLKKEKPLPEIKAEEIPFEIPESWEWVRLGEITSVLSDGIHGTPQYDKHGSYYFINGNNLSNGKIIIKSNTKTVSKDMALKYQLDLNETTCFVSINGTIGNTAFYNNEPVILGKSACYFNLMGNIEKKYINQVILSDYFMRYALAEATGTTIKNVSLKAMRNFLIPLPPLAEQKRIVAKIEELLSCCGALGNESTA